MAYEKMDKQALATMARDYDRKSKPKVGFWGGLFSGTGVATSQTEHTVEDKPYWDDVTVAITDYPSIYTRSYNYSPMVGDDWD